MCKDSVNFVALWTSLGWEYKQGEA